MSLAGDSGNKGGPADDATPPRRFGPFVTAIIVVLIAIFTFSVMGAIIKHLSPRYSAEQLSAFRNAFGLIPSVTILLASRDWHVSGRPLKIRQWRLALARGGLVAVAQVCFYTALTRIEYATASTLAFASPLFITALSVPLLGDRVGVWRWAAVLTGFAGILLIMRPGSEVFTPYAVLPIGAAACYASSSILVRRMDSNVPSTTLNIYASSGALIGSFSLMMATGGYKPIETAQDWAWLMAMGLFGGVAVLCLITAYRLTKPSNLAPFEYFGIPFSFIIGWFAFGEAPFDQLIPGALLITAAGLLIFWRERRRRQP